VRLPVAGALRDALEEGRRKPAARIAEHTYVASYLPGSPGFSAKAFVWGEEPVYLGRRAHVVVVDDWSAGDPGGLARRFGWPPSSVLLGALFLENDEIGTLLLRAAGRGLYTAEHAELWALLNAPAGIALSNYCRYLQVLRLHDLLSRDNRNLRERLKELPPDEIIGADLGLRDVMSQVDRVAPLDSPVLLLGETGTGKELIVRAICRRSRRTGGPFVPVNCGAIPATLLDSELFGHERGAFTGAVTQRKGFFERAHGGTIFLDEVGELPLELQARLLRVLQEKQFERVGGTETVSVDIRVIAATHRDLPQMVTDGRFRDDLYFRLSVFPIAVPPLRERRDDIPVLVDHFLRLKGKQMALGYVPPLAPGALDRLLGYAWPGNVRELENAVERALILSRGEPLAFEELGGGQAG
jgi:transcriptional regulator with GAF, ATPase, and Fis domain